MHHLATKTKALACTQAEEVIDSHLAHNVTERVEQRMVGHRRGEILSNAKDIIRKPISDDTSQSIAHVCTHLIILELRGSKISLDVLVPQPNDRARVSSACFFYKPKT